MSWWTFKGDAKNLFGLPEKGKKQATAPKAASPEKPPLKPLVQIQSNKIAEIELQNRLFFKTRSWTSNSKARATTADKLFLKRKLTESRTLATKLEPEYCRVNMKQVSNAKTKPQVEKLKANLQKWNETLAERSIRVSVLDTTLQEIFNYFNNFVAFATDDPESLNLLLKNVTQHLDDTCVLETKLLAYKVYYQLSFGNQCTFHATQDMLCRGAYMANKFAIHGMLHSNTDYYYRFMSDADEMREYCLKAAECHAITVENYKFLPYALESLIKVIELYGYKAEMSERLWKIIVLHLDTQYTSQVLTLMLFTHVIKDVDYLNRVILKDVLCNFSWLNRNKYELLAIILSRNNYSDLRRLEECRPYLEPELFFRGLTLGLKHENLTASSATLAAALNDHPSSSSYLTTAIAEFIKNCDTHDLHNLNNCWTKSYDSIKIYHQLMDFGDTTLDDITRLDEYASWRKNNCEKFIILRHMFANEFSTHPGYLDFDRLFVIQYGTQHSNVKIRKLTFEILLINSFKLKEEQHYMMSTYAFYDCIRKNTSAEDSKYIFEKLPTVLLRFAQTIKASAVVTHRKMCMQELFRLIQNISLDDSYPTRDDIIYRLRMLDLFLQFYEKYPDLFFVARKPNNETVQSLREQFKTVIESNVENLLISDCEDVRVLMRKVVTKYFIGKTQPVFYPDNVGAAQFATRCLDLVYSNDIDEALLSHEFHRLHLHTFTKEEGDDDAILESFEYNHKKLAHYFQLFKIDPFLALCRESPHLFGYINCMHETLRFEPISAFFVALHKDIVSSESLAMLRDEVVNEMLDPLNFAETQENQRPSVKLMLSSFQNCVLQSGLPQEDIEENLDKDRTVFLRSIYLTLKANCEFSSSIVKHFFTNNDESEISKKQITNALIMHKNILIKCCYQKTVEAAGNSLGAIVKNLTHSWSNNGVPGRLFYDELIQLVKSELIDLAIKLLSTGNIELKNDCGLFTMFHQIAKNDTSDEQILFNYCLNKILPISLTEVTAKDLTELYQNNQPSHLTLLTNLINDQDPDLNAKITPFIAQALLVSFEKLQHTDCNEHHEAATKLFKAICQKMSNHQLPFDDADQLRLCELPTEFISYEDVFTKYPIVWEYIAKNSGTSSSLDAKILAFLTHFQYRGIIEQNNDRYLEISEKVLAKNWKNDKVDRFLRQFDGHVERVEDLPKNIGLLTFILFEDAYTGIIYEIKYRLKRFVSDGLYIYDDDVKFFEKIRMSLEANYAICPDVLHLTPYKHQLLDLYVFVGFTKTDKILAKWVEWGGAETDTKDKWKDSVALMLPEKAMSDEPMAGVVLHELNLNYEFRFKA